MAGWREGRDPAPWFSAEGYLAANPDVAAAGPRAVLALPRRGPLPRPRDRAVAAWPPTTSAEVGLGAARRESTRASDLGRAGQSPAAGRRRGSGRAADAVERAARAVAAEFDARLLPGLESGRGDLGYGPAGPLHPHRLAGGPRSERRASRCSTTWRPIRTSPAANINPFAHYLTAGRAEGRSPRHELGFRYDVIARLQPVEVRIAEAASASARAAADPPGRWPRPWASSADLHVTFSHDNYVEHSGGLQFCVRREAEQFASRGVTHLHLYPAVAWPAVRAAGEAGPLGVLLNGRRLGVFHARGRARRPAGRGRRPGPPQLRDPQPAGPRARRHRRHPGRRRACGSGFFWLHDFASLCAGFHLLRNDVEDCAAPPADSAGVRVCAYGPSARAPHRGSPAAVRAAEHHGGGAVADHAGLLAHARRPAGPRRGGAAARRSWRRAGRRARPQPAARSAWPTSACRRALKGWPVFRDLAHALGGRSALRVPAPGRRARSRRAGGVPQGGGHRRTAAAPCRRRWRRCEADAALIWPLCRETFSFTAYEAAAAGAAVLTGPDSGNVAAFAADPAVGRVLRRRGGAGRGLRVRRRSWRWAAPPGRPTLYDLTYSGMTGDLRGGMKRLIAAAVPHAPARPLAPAASRPRRSPRARSTRAFYLEDLPRRGRGGRRPAGPLHDLSAGARAAIRRRSSRCAPIWRPFRTWPKPGSTRSSTI